MKTQEIERSDKIDSDVALLSSSDFEGLIVTLFLKDRPSFDVDMMNIFQDVVGWGEQVMLQLADDLQIYLLTNSMDNMSISRIDSNKAIYKFFVNFILDHCVLDGKISLTRMYFVEKIVRTAALEMINMKQAKETLPENNEEF